MDSSQLNTPVLFLVFNRPDTTRLAFEAIRKVRPNLLFVSADGPRTNNPADLNNCKLVREVIKTDWPCTLRTMYHNENLGCGKAPSTAITWFFRNVEQGIILEDDCIPNTDFFFYCQELLNKYRTDLRVFNICGSNLGYHVSGSDSYFISKFMNMSGWATWKRTAEKVDYQLKYWMTQRNIRLKLFKKLRYKPFDYDLNWIMFWEEKIYEIIGNQDVDFWDYQWILNQIQNNAYSIIPQKNLVKNIGFDVNATHTKSPDHEIANIQTEDLEWPLIHPKKLKMHLEYEEIFIKKNWLMSKRLKLYQTFMILIRRSIKRVLGE